MAKPVVIQVVGGDLGGINARLDDVAAKLSGIVDSVAVLGTNQGKLMATTAEVAQLAQDIVTALQPLGPAIDALEAQITALKSSGALTPQQQADLDAAFAALTSVKTDVASKVADATDGIDEAASGGGGPV